MRLRSQIAGCMSLAVIAIAVFLYSSAFLDTKHVGNVFIDKRFQQTYLTTLRSSGNYSQVDYTTRVRVQDLKQESVSDDVQATGKARVSVNADTGHDEAALAGNGDAKVVVGYRNVVNGQPLKMNCKACALISSSGRILGHKKGSEIDKTHCVFRMNNAPVKGFEMDVGHKTTARVVAFNSLGRTLALRVAGVKYIVWTNNQPGAIKKVVSQLKSSKMVDAYVSTKDYIQLMDKLFEQETKQSRIGSHIWLSTGWFAFDLLTQICPSTKIYGMIPEDFCKNQNQPPVPYHYWEPNTDECKYYVRSERFNRRGSHRFISEKKIFARWAVMSNMTFHAPEWDPKDYSKSEVGKFV